MPSSPTSAPQRPYQDMQQERASSSQHEARSRPRSSDQRFCLQLAVVPGLVMAKHASPTHKGYLWVLIFMVVSALYVGGIACFTLSATASDPLFVIRPGDPIPAPLVFLIAWVLYITGPFVTIILDAYMLLVATFAMLDEERRYSTSDSSVTLVLVHLISQAVLMVLMMIQSWQVKAKGWHPSWCEAACGSCCCPHCYLASALEASEKERLSHDELPAYSA